MEIYRKDGPEQKIMTFREEKESVDSFVVASSQYIVVFEYEHKAYKALEIKISDFGVHSRITSCFVMQRAGVETKKKGSENELIIVTGHRNGAVYVWEGLTNRRTLIESGPPILFINAFDLGLIITTENSVLSFVKNPHCHIH